MAISNLIVGTGPTALAAAMALRRLNVPFEVVDVGYDLEADREDSVRNLAQLDPRHWPAAEVSRLFPPPVTSAGGVEKRFSFGSEFPYRRPSHLSITAENCVVDVSHGRGGFGNVWGAATLTYSENDLRGWPIRQHELSDSYAHVAQYVPASAEADDLGESFPVFSHTFSPLQRSEQTERLLQALASKRAALRGDGVSFGRARVAVETSGPSGCRYCGACLDGCVYGSLFNPRNLWKKLEEDGVVVHRGFYALEYAESSDCVRLTTVGPDGAVRNFDARRIFVGAGAVATTRFVARSLKLIGQPVRILDSQYFFFPLLAYRGAADLTVRFTLAEVFVEVLNEAISRNYVHFQVYGLNEIFRQTLKAMVPAPLRQSILLNPVEKRFYLLQGFLNSADSGYLEMEITESQATSDRVHLRGVTNPDSLRVARRTQALLRRHLRSFGFIPWLYLKMTPLGRSFHAGGSFPMNGSHSIYRSDLMGRPAQAQRVHLLDASTFPSIPATTITLTAMANADRIIEETYRQGCLC